MSKRKVSVEDKTYAVTRDMLCIIPAVTSFV